MIKIIIIISHNNTNNSKHNDNSNDDEDEDDDDDDDNNNEHVFLRPVHHYYTYTHGPLTQQQQKSRSILYTTSVTNRVLEAKQKCSWNRIVKLVFNCVTSAKMGY